MAPLLFAGLIGFLCIGVLLVRRGRTRMLARIRAEWGIPVRRERRLQEIAASHQSRCTHLGVTRSLDTRTWDDLDLDAVFAAIDRTTSTVGQHALYHRLRSAPGSGDLEAFESLVTHLSREAGPRERAQLALARLSDPHGYSLWWLAQEGTIGTSPWYVLFPMMAVATIGLLVASLLSPSVAPVLVGILLANVATRYVTDRHIGSLATAFRQVAPVIAVAESLRHTVVVNASPLLAALHVDVRPLRRLKNVARWIGGDPLLIPFGAGIAATAARDVLTAAYEYLNLAFLLDGTGVYVGARLLRARHRALLRAIVAIGDIDVAISTASFRAGQHEWTRPRFGKPSATVQLTDIRHPLLEQAAPNSVNLAPGRGLLITGSNMSGKSTLLRTVGVTVVMAQTLNTCLAAAYDAPPLDVRSCIGRSDDLLSGTSYYVAEVRSLLGLVQGSESAAPHLFLLDELFRGTNAVERIAAGRAVLLELISGATRPSPHVVLAATHDGELVDLLTDTYAAVHFGDAVGDNGLVFDHRLRPGPATTRNAIALLRIHGAPSALIARASECAALLDVHRGATLLRR